MSHFAHGGPVGALLLPSEIFRDPRLKPSEVMFLASLCIFADNTKGSCNPSLTTLYEVSGISPGNTSPTIKSLVSKGWLEFTRGGAHASNFYRITIPVEGGGYKGKPWFYRRSTDKKISDDAWKIQGKVNSAKISADKLKALLRRTDFYIMGPDELILHLAAEVDAGRQWVPLEHLENMGLIRGGDNSEAGRASRRGEGISDRFEDLGMPETFDRFTGMTKKQVLDIGFEEGDAAIDDATLSRFYISRNAFF